jgi:hypothetical protein
MKIIFVFLCVAVLLSISACSSKEVSEYKRGFIDSCNTFMPKKVCACAYDKLNEKYPTDDLMEMLKGKGQSKKLKGFSMNDYLAYSQSVIQQCATK